MHLQCKNGCSECVTPIPQYEISTYIKLLTDQPIEYNNQNIIPPYEIDIYLQNYQLAIEYHGMFWHSYDRHETIEEKHSHKIKADLAVDTNLKLLQFFEHEWRHKQDIVKSIIKSKIGLTTKLDARKLRIAFLTRKEIGDFFDKNHMQGHRSAEVYVGLVDSNEIKICVSFSHHPKHEWEVIRAASLLNHTIRGGLSKLFKEFIDNYYPESILTYADRRYSNSNAYQQFDFKLSDITKPNYYYIDNNDNIYSRQRFQKHKLPKLLPNFDPLLTESTNMFNNGYRRFWDAGHYKLLWLR